MRERVANYLELPNNLTTNLQEKAIFPALRLHLYDIRKSAVNGYVSLIRSMTDN